MAQWNKEKIIHLLETNDLAVGRALMVPGQPNG